MMYVYVSVDACMPCVCVCVSGVGEQISGVSFPLLLWDLDLGIELRLLGLRTKHFYQRQCKFSVRQSYQSK